MGKMDETQLGVLFYALARLAGRIVNLLRLQEQVFLISIRKDGKTGMKNEGAAFFI